MRTEADPIVLSFLRDHEIGTVSGFQALERRAHYARRPPRLVLDLSGGTTPPGITFSGLFHHSPDKALVTLDDARLVGISNFISMQADPDGRPVLRTCYVAAAADTRTLVTRDVGSFAQTCSGLVASGREVALTRARLADPVELSGHTLFATPNEPHHWGLWLLETLPTLQRFLDAPGRYDRVLAHVHHPNMRATLDLLGLDGSALMDHDVTRAYRLERVTIPRWHGHDFHVHPHERRVFDTLARVSARLHPSTPDRIFVARRSRGRYRQLLNEADLIAGFEALGFAIIEPEHLTAAEQIATFAQARMVAGLGGGGLFNTVFCRPDTKVLSFDRSEQYLQAHANLFASAGLDYGYVIGRPEPHDRHNLNGDWRLDVAAALPAARRFFGLS